jgi:hypothetical protein
MNGLPETFDCAFLKEKVVERVCFAAYQVNLHFEGNVWIQIEGRYRLLAGDNTLEVVDDFPLLQSLLPQLIGKKTVDVSFSPKSGNIEIFLENGTRLQIDGDIGPYESYRLFDGRNETIV